MTQSSDAPRIPNAEILTTLGTGGMGKVYLARFSRTAFGFEKLLAVKVVRPERTDDRGVEAMFVDEARLVARIDHPSVAQVFDFGRADGAFYLVMEYVQGCSLGQLLTAGFLPPPLICAAIAARVCRGLHAAHELRDTDGALLNVVHRDVTPSNLVLTYEGDVKILDFGIALMRARSAPVTGAGQIRGKPTYLAPEQVDAEPISRRTDIYSLSIVLHELLTGQKLFRLEDMMSEHTQSLPRGWREIASRVRPPSETVGPLPKGLDEVVMTGLALEPESRFHNARAMAQALETVIEREGTENLAAYVDRELAELRSEHEANLRALLGGERAQLDNRPHPKTESAVSPPQGAGTATELKTHLVRPFDHADRSASSDPSEELPNLRRTWRPAALLVVAVLAAAVAASAAFVRTPNTPSEIPNETVEPPAPEVVKGPPLESAEPDPVPQPEPTLVAAPPPVMPEMPSVAKKADSAKKRPARSRRQAERARPRRPKRSAGKDGAASKRDPDIITEW